MTPTTAAATTAAARTWPEYARRMAGRVGGSRGGLFGLALIVGVGAGLGAVAFRYLITGFTWLATGHSAFGQQGYTGSTHLPWLGLGFLVVIPAVGGLIYGPMIYRWAREARGHGVPEVMIAVADNGGRIRPQVSLVKAVASALCIGTGGSVGREGPIVQIGSALASSLGQWVRMPENRMRVLVACGAGGGIAATFNAPITGVFFGVEIILREFSIDALFSVMLSTMVADVIGQVMLGSGRFLSGFPAGVVLRHPVDYLLVAVLAVVAALIGVAFKNVLYKTEDICDRLWRGRPEWARPAVGGVALGLLLLALPQMYGVGYPVMYKAVAGNYVLWFLIVLAAGKMLATSLSIGIGGSGGVFAPSLFIGATSGMAFGEVAGHLLGPAAGPPALYAAVAMGAVFASAARAPLTSLASVVEMTGDFALTLPVMLAIAIATAVSRTVSYGTIYTTKLLRRGTDIDQPPPWQALRSLTVSDAMRRFTVPLAVGAAGGARATGPAVALPGPVTSHRDPHVLPAGESLEQTLRQLMAYDADGLPVLSADGSQVEGWITDSGVIKVLSERIHGASAHREAARDVRAADWSAVEPEGSRAQPAPLRGYRVIEITIEPGTAAEGMNLGDLAWPSGHTVVAVRRHNRPLDPDPRLTVRSGDRLVLLAAKAQDGSGPARAAANGGAADGADHADGADGVDALSADQPARG